MEIKIISGGEGQGNPPMGINTRIYIDGVEQCQGKLINWVYFYVEANEVASWGYGFDNVPMSKLKIFWSRLKRKFKTKYMMKDGRKRT